jgi:hypothetical protein
MLLHFEHSLYSKFDYYRRSISLGIPVHLLAQFLTEVRCTEVFLIVKVRALQLRKIIPVNWEQVYIDLILHLDQIKQSCICRAHYFESLDLCLDLKQ